mmetsp:Transcript_10059/g.16074  ORF Transcript_10059/g.16074 Transcript_10059/m.16074 type:complete len:218 (+) Transcript_10059:1224-1877(+)
MNPKLITAQDPGQDQEKHARVYCRLFVVKSEICLEHSRLFHLLCQFTKGNGGLVIVLISFAFVIWLAFCCLDEVCIKETCQHPILDEFWMRIRKGIGGILSAEGTNRQVSSRMTMLPLSAVVHFIIDDYQAQRFWIRTLQDIRSSHGTDWLFLRGRQSYGRRSQRRTRRRMQKDRFCHGSRRGDSGHCAYSPGTIRPFTHSVILDRAVAAAHDNDDV